MQVIIVTPYYPHPANLSYGIFIHQQALALQARGYEVRVIHPVRAVPFWRDRGDRDFQDRNLAAGREVLEGIPVERIRYYWPSRRNFDGGWCGALGRGLMKSAFLRDRSGEAMILAQWLLPTAAACLRLRRRFGLPLLGIARGGDLQDLAPNSPALKKELAAVLNEADQVAANGEWALRDLARLGFDLAGRELKIIRNAKDLSRFAKVTPPREIKDGLKIVYVGSLYPHKGAGLLLRALGSLAGELKFSLSLFGDGSERAGFAALARELGIAERVDFRGAVPQEEIARAFAGSHLYVQPSLREGSPNALVEAMAAGLACLGTRVGGIPDLIEDGVSGILVEPDPPAALAQAIRNLAAAPETLAAMGENARHRVMAMFSPETAVRQLEEALAATLANKK